MDDSIKVRHGKKMPGVSSHFDHTAGRKVMGQQVLTLGDCKNIYPSCILCRFKLVLVRH